MRFQHRSKCKKEFTEYPALSRVDNETEICPECGIAEVVEAYQKQPSNGGYLIIL